MAKTKAQIIAEAQVVKNATEVGENTATRVGGVLEDLADADGMVIIPVTGTQSGDNITLSSNPFTQVQTAVNAGQHVVVRVTYGSDIVDFTMNTYSASVATYIGTANFLQLELQLICSASSAVITNRSTSNTFSTGESVPNVGIDATPTQDSNNLITSGSVWERVEPLRSVLQNLNGDTLYITDAQGNVVAIIDKDGIESIEVTAQGKKLSTLPELIDFYRSLLYVADADGNVIMKVDANGVHSVNLLSNQWCSKILATYGDSVTALNGGDFSKPYNNNATVAKWAGKVAQYFNFTQLKNRGIGSTTFAWLSNGGQVAWVNTTTGEYVGRDDNYNYDNYEGHVTIPTGCTAIRGSGCSWLRITSMFPTSIKDTIDVVLIQFHNDFHQDMATAPTWVANNSTDVEWAAATQYLGGDYNIGTVAGGIASLIMKLQVWMPQALLVLLTPISGVYINGNENVKDLENVESAKMKTLSELVTDIAYRMSIPSINVYATDCINSLNHSEYITDGMHPYNDAGCKKIARAVASGMLSIIPNF